MVVRLFVADNAIHQHPATHLTATDMHRNAAGRHRERGGLGVGPRQGSEINLRRMAVDVDVDEFPALRRSHTPHR